MIIQHACGCGPSHDVRTTDFWCYVNNTNMITTQLMNSWEAWKGGSWIYNLAFLSKLI